MPKHPENPFQNYEDYMANGPFQMIKLLLPFLPAANQKNMLILIKFLELKYTIDYFQKGHQLSFCSNLSEDASPLEKISSIIDFLPQKEQESIEQMLNMMSVMEAFQSMTGDEDTEDAENCSHSEENSCAKEDFCWEEASDSKDNHLKKESSEFEGDSPKEQPSDWKDYFLRKTPQNSGKNMHSEEIPNPQEQDVAIPRSNFQDTASDSDAKSIISICSNINF